MIVFLTLCLAFILSTLWAISDAAKKDFGTMGRKAAWMFIASIPFVGFIIYLLFGFKKGKKIDNI
jgi:hypothetical protein